MMTSIVACTTTAPRSSLSVADAALAVCEPDPLAPRPLRLLACGRPSLPSMRTDPPVKVCLFILCSLPVVEDNCS